MSFPTALMMMSANPGLATEICGRVANLLAATGTVQTDALLAPAIVNVVTTTATGTGLRLPPVEVSAGMSVANLGANALLVYPASGQTINGGSANASISIPAGKVVQFTGISGAGWIGQVGA